MHVHQNHVKKQKKTPQKHTRTTLWMNVRIPE